MYRTKVAHVQDGEFIDVFLLPYDGLYDALVVSSQSPPCKVLRNDANVG